MHNRNESELAFRSETGKTSTRRVIGAQVPDAKAVIRRPSVAKRPWAVKGPVGAVRTGRIINGVKVWDDEEVAADLSRPGYTPEITASMETLRAAVLTGRMDGVIPWAVRDVEEALRMGFIDGAGVINPDVPVLV